jgi:hypothetical protein
MTEMLPFDFAQGGLSAQHDRRRLSLRGRKGDGICRWRVDLIDLGVPLIDLWVPVSDLGESRIDLDVHFCHRRLDFGREVMATSCSLQSFGMLALVMLVKKLAYSEASERIRDNCSRLGRGEGVVNHQRRMYHE